MNQYFIIPALAALILVIADPSIGLLLIGWAVVVGALLWLLELAIGQKPSK